MHAVWNRSQDLSLLGLPPEIREQIWTHAVVEWEAMEQVHQHEHRTLQQQPIRIDRYNQPLAPAITQTCRQTRAETLGLYYKCNIFESWQPLYWVDDWSQSAFVNFLNHIGPERISWLGHIDLLYKLEHELEFDIEGALREEGFALPEGVVQRRRELSEFHQSCDELGLPRQFGKKGGRFR